jgi:hypothetical protein
VEAAEDKIVSIASGPIANPALGRVAGVVAFAGSAGREAVHAVTTRMADRFVAARRRAPSLYDWYPDADSLPRRPVRFETVASDAIVGTVRNPSTIERDFRPIEPLRNSNWEFRTARVEEAMRTLVTLPPVELYRVGEHYFVIDGHHRVAAAKQLGADVDSLVTELVPRPVGLPSAPDVATAAC